MASITAWAKKVWKDRKTEYPTRRTLTKTDGSQEIVTVARNEGSVSQEGDAFSAENMNDLEERIDAGFTEVTGKLNWFDMKNISGTYTITGTKTNIEICRASLTPGTWLILGFLNGNIGKEIVYNNAIFRGTLEQHCQTVRNSLVSGGGSINVYPITIQTNTDIILGTYDDFDLKGVVFKGTLYAIRLKN